MATGSEAELARRYGPYTNKRVVEYGSWHPHSTRMREIAKGCKEYVGTDMRPSPTVELVHDLHNPLNRDFDVAFVFSLLEHCLKPWIVAKNIEDALVPGGLILVGAPFQWRIHAYPDDYFRYTPNGLRSLFPNVDWKEELTDPLGVELTNHVNGKVHILLAGHKK